MRRIIALLLAVLIALPPLAADTIECVLPCFNAGDAWPF